MKKLLGYFDDWEYYHPVYGNIKIKLQILNSLIIYDNVNGTQCIVDFKGNQYWSD